MAAEQTTIIGVFGDQTAAAAAIQELRQSGFSAKQVGVVVRRNENQGGETPELEIETKQTRQIR